MKPDRRHRPPEASEQRVVAAAAAHLEAEAAARTRGTRGPCSSRARAPRRGRRRARRAQARCDERVDDLATAPRAPRRRERENAGHGRGWRSTRHVASPSVVSRGQRVAPTGAGPTRAATARTPRRVLRLDALAQRAPARRAASGRRGEARRRRRRGRARAPSPRTPTVSRHSAAIGQHLGIGRARVAAQVLEAHLVAARSAGPPWAARSAAPRPSSRGAIGAGRSASRPAAILASRLVKSGRSASRLPSRPDERVGARAAAPGPRTRPRSRRAAG